MSSLESTDPMAVLPQDVFVRILLHLDNGDLNRARLVRCWGGLISRYLPSVSSFLVMWLRSLE
jgi:hypothetical protein